MENIDEYIKKWSKTLYGFKWDKEIDNIMKRWFLLGVVYIDEMRWNHSNEKMIIMLEENTTHPIVLKELILKEFYELRNDSIDLISYLNNQIDRLTYYKDGGMYYRIR